MNRNCLSVVLVGVFIAVLAIPDRCLADGSRLRITGVPMYQAFPESAGAGSIVWTISDTDPLDNIGYTISFNRFGGPTLFDDTDENDSIVLTTHNLSTTLVFANNPATLTENFDILDKGEIPDNQDFGRWLTAAFVNWTDDRGVTAPLTGVLISPTAVIDVVDDNAPTPTAPSFIPEPATLTLLGLGLAGLVARLAKRQNR